MTIQKKSKRIRVTFGTLVACAVVAFILGLFTGVGDDVAPQSGRHTQSQPATQMPAPVAMPNKMQDPSSTKWDEHGNLVCVHGPFMLVEGLDKHSAEDMPIDDVHTIDVAVTAEGLTITGDPYALDRAATSMIVNSAVGTNVPPSYGETTRPPTTILLREKVFGKATTFMLCQ